MDLFSADLPEQGDQPAGVATSAGTSHEPDGAVRSWPDAGDTATEAGGAGAGARPGTRTQGTGLSAMLLPELQRVAQSEGITGTAKMRKGQLIAAIEERRQGGEAGAAGRRGGGLRADTDSPVSTGHEPKADQVKTSGNSVQRGAPAGAGVDRTFEQDAMESQTSTQPGLGGTAAGGIGETQAYESGVGRSRAGADSAPASNGATASAAANGSAGEPAQQTGDGQRGARRRRANARRDEDSDQPRAASDGQESAHDGDSRGRGQGHRDQQGGDE